jgi:hypothetical protein
MRGAVVVSMLAAACSLDESGLDVIKDAASDPVSEPKPVLDASPDVVSDVSDAGVVETGPCNPATCVGERCTNDACAFYATCAEMHQVDPTRPTGFKMLYKSPTSYQAWCDMDDEDGGWTLVGRSATGQQSTTFGWSSASGTDPLDFTKPYSLGSGAGLGFAEGLVGNRTTNLAFDTEIYHLTLPAGFPANFANTSISVTVTTVKSTNNACATNTPSMLSYVGYTAQKYFYFRDNGGLNDYGLNPDHWFTLYADCRGGQMDGDPGMVMAR